MLISETKNFCDDVTFYLKEFLKPFDLKFSIQNEVIYFEEVFLNSFFLPVFLFDQEQYIKSLLKKTKIKNLKFQIILSHNAQHVLDCNVEVIHNLPSEVYNDVLFKTVYNILESKKLTIDDEKRISLDYAYRLYVDKINNKKIIIRTPNDA